MCIVWCILIVRNAEGHPEIREGNKERVFKHEFCHLIQLKVFFFSDILKRFHDSLVLKQLFCCFFCFSKFFVAFKILQINLFRAQLRGNHKHFRIQRYSFVFVSYVVMSRVCGGRNLQIKEVFKRNMCTSIQPGCCRCFQYSFTWTISKKSFFFLELLVEEKFWNRMKFLLFESNGVTCLWRLWKWR